MTSGHKSMKTEGNMGREKPTSQTCYFIFSINILTKKNSKMGVFF
jgi:hypothetical protein